MVLFAFAIPSIIGSGYAEIFEHMEQLTVVELIELTSFWILVMLTYSFVLTNSMPGLTHPQALVLNFAGSAVSNVVPFGGAAGVAVTYTMTMSWGISVQRRDARDPRQRHLERVHQAGPAGAVARHARRRRTAAPPAWSCPR